jgi:hypothetical protein
MPCLDLADLVSTLPYASLGSRKANLKEVVDCSSFGWSRACRSCGIIRQCRYLLMSFTTKMLMHSLIPADITTTSRYIYVYALYLRIAGRLEHECVEIPRATCYKPRTRRSRSDKTLVVTTDGFCATWSQVGRRFFLAAGQCCD